MLESKDKMKKIIFFILIIFLLTGCKHYQEINTLDIVSSVVIDYKNNYYHLIIETKTMVDDDEASSSLIETSGRSIEHALSRLETHSKTLYFANLDVLLLTPDALKKIDYIINYINYHYHININFNMALINDSYEVFEYNQEVFGKHFKAILEKPDNQKYNILYPRFLNDYFSKRILMLPRISFKDEKISLTLVEVPYE